MLKQRVISSLILAPLFIALILLLPNGWFKLLVSLMVLPAAFEWARLSGVHGNGLSWLYALGLIALAYLGYEYVADLQIQHWLYWLSAVWWGLVLVWIVLSQRRAVLGNFSLWVKLFSGVLTILPAWFALIALQAVDGIGPQLALYVFLLVWAADIGAYTFGNLWGRIKLAPLLSPGKTVEGLAGGMLAVLLLALATAAYFGLPVRGFWLFVLISLFAAAVSVLGDLYESALKRQAGVKDSGGLLPGHGGVLDRIDSLIAAAPIFLLGYSQISH